VIEICAGYTPRLFALDLFTKMGVTSTTAYNGKTEEERAGWPTE